MLKEYNITATEFKTWADRINWIAVSQRTITPQLCEVVYVTPAAEHVCAAFELNENNIWVYRNFSRVVAG